MTETMWLNCTQCGERFQIAGLEAQEARSFYDAQPNHTPGKEVGVCDNCWSKRGAPAPPSVASKRTFGAIRFGFAVLLTMLFSLATVRLLQGFQGGSSMTRQRGWISVIFLGVCLLIVFFGGRIRGRSLR